MISLMVESDLCFFLYFNSVRFLSLSLPIFLLDF